MKSENPFADFGTIVHHDRFIGRESDLRVVESRVIRPPEAGNLAVIGEPRIGKSSLLFKSIMERKSNIYERGVVPMWINLATYDSSSEFFRSLVSRCVDELEDRNRISDAIQRAADRALKDDISWSEGYSRIQRFFEKVRLDNIRIWLILDEFDHARHLFRGDVSGFQGLRELSYRPEWRVTLITASRRSIREIELQTQAISTLDGIFHKHYLGMFTDADIDIFFARLESAGIVMDNTARESFLSYAGGHPFLLEMLGFQLVEHFRLTGRMDLDVARRDLEHSFLDQYDRMVDLLREDDTLGKLLQILFGPAYDVRQTEIEEFLRYGLIKKNNENTYSAFSPHFQTYLRLIERQIDLWPLWRETEVTLRQLVADTMITEYGDQWIEKIEKAHPNLRTIFDSCRQAQQKEEAAFGNRASRNLLDFTYPRDLFAIVFAEWSKYRPLLGKDKSYWDQRATLLSKMRNPLAHNRDWMFHEHERQLAEGYCKEILITIGQPSVNH